MATVTMNTAVPAASGSAEYEKYLKEAYGIQGSGMNIKNWTGSGYSGSFGSSHGTSQGSNTESNDKNTSDVNAYINQMYDSSLESQKQKLASNYETDLSNLDAEKQESQRKHDEDLARTYVEAYKKAKNFNEVQNAYGLTSGAMGQAALSSGNQMQADLTALRATQEQIDAEIERQRSILGKEYSAAIAKAQADNDFQRAQALYEQAKIEEERTHQMKLQAAQFMAEYGGDFSLLAEVYGLSPSQVAALSGGGSSSSSSTPGYGSGGISTASKLANLSNAQRKELYGT